MLHHHPSVIHLQDPRRHNRGILIGIEVGRTVSVMEAHVTSLHVEVRRHARRLVDFRLLHLLMGMTGEIDGRTLGHPNVHQLAQTWGESACLEGISPIKMTGASSLHSDAKPLERHTVHRRQAIGPKVVEIDSTQTRGVLSLILSDPVQILIKIEHEVAMAMAMQMIGVVNAHHHDTHHAHVSLLGRRSYTPARGLTGQPIPDHQTEGLPVAP